MRENLSRTEKLSVIICQIRQKLFDFPTDCEDFLLRNLRAAGQVEDPGSVVRRLFQMVGLFPFIGLLLVDQAQIALVWIPFSPSAVIRSRMDADTASRSMQRE